MTLPASPDAFLDDPDVLAANRRDDYMPYWSYLWPTSLETAVAVLTHDWSTLTPQALEIGAGIALDGLGRAFPRNARDVQRLRPAGHRPGAFQCPRKSPRRKRRGAAARLAAADRPAVPLIFGCDVIYETQNHHPILGLLEHMLAKEGECWITDPGRYHADAFVDLLASSPFKQRHQTLVREPYPGRPAGTTNLWVLTWK